MIERFSDATLMKSLSEGVKKLYLVIGNDEFLVDACVESIVKKSGAVGENTTRLEIAKCDDSTLEEPFYSFGFSAGKRVLVLDGFDVGTLKQDRIVLLSELIADIQEGLVVVLRRVSDDERFYLSKKMEQFVAVCDDGAIVEAVRKSGRELEKYIAVLISRQGCKAMSGAVRAIAARCGDDLLLIESEVKKLASLCNYGEITETHVAELCEQTPEFGVYDMLGNLERKNMPKAFGALCEMLDNRTEPLIISSVLNTAFVNIYRAKLARGQGKSEKQMTAMFDYKSGDRKVSIAYGNSEKYSISQIEKIIEILRTLDTELKSSSVDSRIILEAKVAEIAAVTGAAK
ncbi:MAG: DNA polymerase III subunit delta [Oscillospiraceae bacterium]